MTGKPLLVKVAVVQAAPVYLDRQATLEKACALIAEAARAGARLALFPEAFLSGYPDWVWLVPGSRKPLLGSLYAELLENAVSVPDEATATLCEAAAESNIHVAMGMNERNDEASRSSLYNSLLFIDDEGKILGVHRKLVPTGGERLIWTGGAGGDLHVFDTAVGRVGGLICWENLMPLARTAMYQGGAQFHLAPTWDSSEPWLTSMRHIAREGGMYVLNCCAAMPMDALPDRFAFKSLYPEGREWVNVGNSCIIDPNGRYVTEPVREKEEILYGDLDPGRIAEAKWMFDVAGHYARPDVFDFSVRTFDS
jgi:nitrilase